MVRCGGAVSAPAADRLTHGVAGMGRAGAAGGMAGRVALAHAAPPRLRLLRRLHALPDVLQKRQIKGDAAASPFALTSGGRCAILSQCWHRIEQITGRKVFHEFYRMAEGHRARHRGGHHGMAPHQQHGPPDPDGRHLAAAAVGCVQGDVQRRHPARRDPCCCGALLEQALALPPQAHPAALVVRSAEHERLRGRPAALRRPLLLHGQDRHVAEDRGFLPACHAHRPASERLARQALL